MTEYDKFTTIKANPVMKEYYSRVLGMEPSDFESFWGIIQEQLPVTFRINPLHNNYEALVSKMFSSDFLANDLGVRLVPVVWYPDNLAWEINSNRSELRKHPNVKHFHQFLQKANESGLITRQELASMIPPIVLEPAPGEKVLDMCAAPGSKTAQMIELMKGEGLVVANDVDTKRAYMLIHQLHRINTSSMVVVNHQAQNFPRLSYSFDKVLCDVPCSGDGAIRKLPTKWRNWNVRDGQGLHALQVSIFRRGVQLLRPGGLICYSTCSLNPIENEAVVNTVAKEFDLEVIDLHEVLRVKCPGLILRPGFEHWKVLGNAKDKELSNFIEYSNFEEVPANITHIKPTMFAQQVIQGMQKTVRLMPHDQNTGGFFVGLFRKRSVATFEDSVTVAGDAIAGPLQRPKKKKKILHDAQQLYVPLESVEDFSNLQQCFGLEKLPMDRLLSPLTKHMKNLFFVSDAVKEFLGVEECKSLKILNVGVCAFTRNKHVPSRAKFAYRPHQDALPFISNHITRSRIASSDLQLLKDLLNSGKFESNNYPDLALGYYLLTFPEINEEVLIIKVGAFKYHTVIPKEHIDSLKLRYSCLN